MRQWHVLLAGAIFLILGACASTAAGTPQEPTTGEWDPRTVSPAWLELLLTDLADTEPVAAAIDLDGAAASERFSGRVEEKGNTTWYRDEETGGYFVSEHVGCTPEGVHVFRLDACYGGSGVFASLIFVTHQEDRVVSCDGRRRRHVLRSLGEHPLGDRFAGTVSLKGNTVTISRHDGTEEEVALQGLK